MLSPEQIVTSQEFKNFTKSIDMNEESIEYFFLHSNREDKVLNEIEVFLRKYSACFYNNIRPVIAEEDIKILFALKDNSFNSCFTAYICYLISCTNVKNVKYDFTQKAKMALADLLKGYKTTKGFLPCHSFKFLIIKLLENADNIKDKKEIIEFSLNELKGIELENIFRLSSTVFLLSVIKQNQIYSLKTSEKIIEIGKEFIHNIEVETNVDYQRVEIVEDLMDEMIGASNNKTLLKKEEGMFLFNNRNVFQFVAKQEKLAKIVRRFEEANAPFELINSAKQALAQANKESLESMKPISIPISKKLQNSMDSYYKKILQSFERLNNYQRLLKIISEIHIIGLDEINKQIKETQKQSVIMSIFPVTHLDRDGRIIKNDLPKEKQEFLTNAVRCVDITIETTVNPVINAFFRYYNMDDDSEKFLKEILTDNPICESSRANYIFKVIKGILNKEFDVQLRNIIAEIEAGLRHFFVIEGLSPIEFKNDKQVYIDINTIFKNIESNEYRKCLASFLEDDYLFILEYLFSINPGGNIRNDAMHGNIPPDEMNSYKAIYLMLLIIKLYYGFYCVKLEKDDDGINT